MMSSPFEMSVVKTSGEMARVSTGKRVSKHCVASGGNRCGYWIRKRERR
jgi:hypothetical protein